MKSQLKSRPHSKTIRSQSAKTGRKDNQVLSIEYFSKAKNEQLNQCYQKAIEFYMLATTCKPTYFQAFCNMGFCYRALGRFSEAKYCYLKSLQCNYEDAITHYNLGNLYRVLGENQLAIQQYNIVIRLKQKGVEVGNLSVNSLINIGVCYKNQGEIQSAIEINQQILQGHPSEESATFNLAICLLSSIQKKNMNLLTKFYMERVQQAEILFKQVLSNSRENFMAELSLIKLQVIRNQSEQNVEKAISALKNLLDNPKCNIKNEVNQEIGKMLSLNKRYNQSAHYYKQSINKIKQNQEKRGTKKQDGDIFRSFEDDRPLKDFLQEAVFISEEQGIEMIEAGKYSLIKQKIQQLSDQNLLKPTLNLILYLKLSETNSQYLSQAFQVYHKYFDKDQQELPFERLSLECHKAIGRILSQQQKYEQATRHYGYISQKMADDRNCASAKSYSELGQRFEEVGKRQKAVEEYKKGIQIEPQDYSLSYSLGYCLYEIGNYGQAKQQFQKIISQIQSDNSLPAQMKSLYLTDCRIIFALCHTGEDDHQVFISAFESLQELRKSKQYELQMDKSNLLLFFIKLSDIYEEKLSKISAQDEVFEDLAQILIDVYQNLLEQDECPDKDEVLINTGNLYYLIGQYLSAVQAYSQVVSPPLIPYLNMGLSYFMLIEPYLAIKNIKQASLQDPQELINKICLQIVLWAFSNECSGRWSKHLPKWKADLFYPRYLYASILLDKLSQLLNSGRLNQNKQQLLEELCLNSSAFRTSNQANSIKNQKLRQLSIKYNYQAPSIQKNLLSPQILQLCFSKSNNIESDLKKLIDLLQKLPVCGRQLQLSKAALYLFVFYNQNNSLEILQGLLSMERITADTIDIDFGENLQDLSSIYSDFKNGRQLVGLLAEWQSALEKNTRLIINLVENHYYQGNIMQPLQFQSHFPIHHYLQESNSTFLNIVSVAAKKLQFKPKISFKGNNIKQMKAQLIRSFEKQLNHFLKSNQLSPIHLSHGFLPLSITAYHQSKEDSEQFIRKMGKSMGRQMLLVSDCEEYILIINRVMELRCRWGNPYKGESIIKRAIQGILQSPLYIVNQAILYLEAITKTLKKDSLQAKKYISLDHFLDI